MQNLVYILKLKTIIDIQGTNHADQIWTVSSQRADHSQAMSPWPPHYQQQIMPANQHMYRSSEKWAFERKDCP